MAGRLGGVRGASSSTEGDEVGLFAGTPVGIVTRTVVGAESWWRDEDEAARADFSLVVGAVEVGVGRLDVGAGSRAGAFGRCWTGEEEVGHIEHTDVGVLLLGVELLRAEKAVDVGNGKAIV